MRIGGKVCVQEQDPSAKHLHRIASPGTPPATKWGITWWGRFLVQKTRGKMLQRTIRVRFLPLDFRTIFGTRKWGLVLRVQSMLLLFL